MPSAEGLSPTHQNTLKVVAFAGDLVHAPQQPVTKHISSVIGSSSILRMNDPVWRLQIGNTPNRQLSACCAGVRGCGYGRGRDKIYKEKMSYHRFFAATKFLQYITGKEIYLIPCKLRDLNLNLTLYRRSSIFLNTVVL